MDARTAILKGRPRTAQKLDYVRKPTDKVFYHDLDNDEDSVLMLNAKEFTEKSILEVKQRL